jgi:hypothetical protein
MIQPDENPLVSTGKVAIRVPLAVLSLGTSEMMADCVSETARQTGLPTTPNSPVWDICNRRSDIAEYRAGMAGAAQGMAAAQERAREQVLQERAVRAIERVSEPQYSVPQYQAPVTVPSWNHLVASLREVDSLRQAQAA